MVRILLVFISAIAILLSSCTTTGSNVFSSDNRKADIVEALSSEKPDDGKMDLALELPFADTVRNTPVQTQPEAEDEIVPVQTEEAVVETAPAPEVVPEVEVVIDPDNAETEQEEPSRVEPAPVIETVDAPTVDAVQEESIPC